MIRVPGGWIDLAAAVIVCVSAFWIGGRYVRIPIVARYAGFNQDSMGPSVTIACGRGFRNVDELPAVQPFLLRTVDSFDCAQLPVRLEPTPLTAFQSASRYLLTGVGWVWAATGVSWTGLWVLFAGLYALVGVLTFYAARILFGRWLSLALTALLVISSTQLSQLPNLRDYSKAPFFMAMLLIIMRIVMKPTRAVALVGLSVLAGVLMGIAFGIRFDMTMFMVFFIVAVLLFPEGRFRGQVRVRLLAAAGCVAAFFIVAAPILLSFQFGNNSWHLILLGLSAPQDSTLTIRRSYYELLPMYHDTYVVSVVSAFWTRTHGATSVLRLNSAEYSRAGAGYYATLAQTFPADLAARAIAAVTEYLGLPFSVSSQLPAGVSADSSAGWIYSGRSFVTTGLGASAPWLMLAAIACVAFTNIRVALFAVAGVLFFGAVSSLQFQYRHIFHLEVIPVFLVGVLIHAAGGGAIRLVRRQPWPAWPDRLAIRATRAAVLVLGLPLVAMAALWLLRTYQQPRVVALFDQYLQADVENVPANWEPASGGYSLARVPTVDAPAGAGMPSMFYVAEFGGRSCDLGQVDAEIRYQPSASSIDFSRPVHVRVPDAATDVTRVFIATFTSPESESPRDRYRFAGLSVPTAATRCVQRLGRVRGADHWPLLLDVNIHPRWRDQPTYQALAHWERPSAAGDRRSFTFPIDVPVRREEWARGLKVLEADVDYRSHIATVVAPGQLRIGGRISQPSAYLVAWKPGAAAADDLLVVEGELREGAFTVGLQREGQWTAQLPVTTPGLFRAAIRVSSGGVYAPVLSNSVSGPWSPVSVNITRIGWSRAGAEPSAP